MYHWPSTAEYADPAIDRLNLTSAERANAEGFAANSPRFTAMSSFQYDEKAVVDSIADPCKNCEKLLVRLGLTLENFKKPAA